MTDEAAGLYNLRQRRIVFPEEAITTVKILEAIGQLGFYRVAMKNGREVWASVPRDEGFEVGEEAEVLMTFDSKEFEVIPTRKDTAELGVWPESQQEGRVTGYRYIGRIEGMYDWNVDRGLYSRSVSIGLIVLIDVGFPLTVHFDFGSGSDDKPYFGFSDYISGVGGFGIVHTSIIRNYVRYVKGPPWRMRSVEVQFMEDERHQLPSPSVPSKAARKEIRKKVRDLEKEERKGA